MFKVDNENTRAMWEINNKLLIIINKVNNKLLTDFKQIYGVSVFEEMHARLAFISQNVLRSIFLGYFIEENFIMK